MSKKKYKAYIDTKVTPFTFVIEFNKSIVIKNDIPYQSKGSARRLAIQCADRLKLDLEWVPESVNDDEF
jgi:hypothetical protein